MNNYIFSQDPLLFQRPAQQPLDDGQLRMQLEQAIQQYQSMQAPQAPQPQQQKDLLGELDGIIKNLNPDVAEILAEDDEYISINNWIQSLIQEEIMKSVRWKINSNPDAIKKIEHLKIIIENVSKEKEAEERKNLAELNDYIKNYSSLSFDEYKRLKGVE